MKVKLVCIILISLFYSCSITNKDLNIVYNKADSLQISMFLNVADTSLDLQIANQYNMKAGELILKQLQGGNRSEAILKQHSLQLNNHGLFGAYGVHNELELPYYYKSLGIAEHIKDVEMIGTLSSNLAHYFAERMEYDLAVSYYNVALNNFIKAEKKGEMAHIYNIMGVALVGQNKTEEALACYQKGISLLEDKNITEKELLAICLSNIGRVYKLKKEFDLALLYYTKASSINKEIGNKSDFINCIQTKGIIFLEQKELDSAKVYLTNALQLCDSYKLIELKGKTLNSLISYYKVIGDAKQLTKLQMEVEKIPERAPIKNEFKPTQTDTLFYQTLKLKYKDSLLGLNETRR